MNYEILCRNVVETAKRAGVFIRQQHSQIQSKDIEIKGKHDLVTFVDKNTEKMLVESLKQFLPQSDFLAEEGTVERLQENEFRWIIDPLDGTTNYIHKIPCFAISIALEYKDEIVLGVIYEINMDECFYAWKGGGAFLNEKQIHVSETATLNDSLIATGFPYNDFSKAEYYLSVFKDLMENTRGIRRLGSASVDLAYVACGRFEAFYEYSLKPWDVAAGIIIVKEAGGEVFDFSGGNNYLFGQEIVATNKVLSKSMLEILKKHF